MSVATTTRHSELREPRVRIWIRALRPRPVAAIAVLVTVGGVADVTGSDVLLRPGWFALFSAWNVLAFTAVALPWLVS
jgi:hypothetical protein